MSMPKFECSRRMFLLGSATTVAGAFLAACGTPAPEEVATAEVPVGSAIFAGNIIIAQPTEGEFVAYSRRCPHQNNRIDKIEGENVRCSAHNSTFRLKDGSVISGLAKDPLIKGNVEVKGDTVTASL